MTAQVDGYALECHGNAEGPAVLWIHGYTMNARIWRGHCHSLPQWKHLAVDLPAHGRASPLRKGQTLDSWIEGLATLARAYDVHHIVAISFGGLVALSLAARMGAELHTLVLNSPAVPRAIGDPAAQACSLAMQRQFSSQGRGPWLTETWLEWPHAIFSGIRAHPHPWHSLRTAIESHGWYELEDGSINRMVLNTSLAVLARTTHARTLLISGEHDIEVFKRYVEILRRELRDVRRVRAAGCGHLALLEQPELAICLIGQHLCAAPGGS
jgi:pimeloyl-ACP methyl ester carboxylesterase